MFHFDLLQLTYLRLSVGAHLTFSRNRPTPDKVNGNIEIAPRQRILNFTQNPKLEWGTDLNHGQHTWHIFLSRLSHRHEHCGMGTAKQKRN